MSAIATEVFSFVSDYATEVSKSKKLLTEFDEDQGLVLFCREFFNQFLAAEFGVQIEYFSSRRAADAWVKIKPKLKADDPRTTIVAAFREFCQDYATIIGEHYDKGGELTGFQREFVPDLLQDIREWVDDDDELREAAEAAEADLGVALEVAWAPE